VSAFQSLVQILSHNRSKENLSTIPFSPRRDRGFSTPEADKFLSFAVVVRRRIIALGVLGTILLRDKDHASILNFDTIVNYFQTITSQSRSFPKPKVKMKLCGPLFIPVLPYFSDLPEHHELQTRISQEHGVRNGLHATTDPPKSPQNAPRRRQSRKQSSASIDNAF